MISINKHIRIRVSIIVMIAVVFSIFSYMTPVFAAKPAPTVKGGTVAAGSTIKLNISKKAKCKIKTVEAYSDNRSAVKVTGYTKTAVTVQGVSAPGANVYVYIVYKYGKTTNSILKKVSVKVNDGSSPIPSPDASETPKPVATDKPTPAPTESIVPTPEPVVSTEPEPQSTLSPPSDPDAVPCARCGATGTVGGVTCDVCHGTGWIVPAG